MFLLDNEQPEPRDFGGVVRRERAGREESILPLEGGAEDQLKTDQSCQEGTAREGKEFQ